MDRPTCKTCPYFFNVGGEDGVCRKHAPRPSTPTVDVERWQTIPVEPCHQATDWCGEHPDFPAWIESRSTPLVD